MARGFESKSVQEQWQDAEARQAERGKKKLPAAEVERNKRREDLTLSRSRVSRELEETGSDRRRESLRAALDHLDRELANLRGTQ